MLKRWLKELTVAKNGHWDIITRHWHRISPKLLISKFIFCFHLLYFLFSTFLLALVFLLFVLILPLYLLLSRIFSSVSSCSPFLLCLLFFFTLHFYSVFAFSAFLFPYISPSLVLLIFFHYCLSSSFSLLPSIFFPNFSYVHLHLQNFIMFFLIFSFLKRFCHLCSISSFLFIYTVLLLPYVLHPYPGRNNINH